MKKLNEFRFWGVFRVLGRDLIFPEFGLKLGDDLLEYAHQLPYDGLCNVWERFVLILTSFIDFCARPFSVFVLFLRSSSRWPHRCGLRWSPMQSGSAPSSAPPKPLELL